MDTPKRYHPLLVTLHWLVAVLVSIELYLGFFVIGQARPGGGPGYLALHMATGIAVLALVIVRFVVRLRSRKPAEVNVGNPFLQFLARFVHYGLYVMLLVITIIGLTMAIQTHMLQAAFTARPTQFAQAPGGAPPQGMAPPSGVAAPPAGRLTGPENGGNRPGLVLPGFLSGGVSPLLVIHGLSAVIIVLLVGLHVAATIYHQVFRRENLLARMWYGPR